MPWTTALDAGRSPYAVMLGDLYTGSPMLFGASTCTFWMPADASDAPDGANTFIVGPTPLMLVRSVQAASGLDCSDVLDEFERSKDVYGSQHPFTEADYGSYPEFLIDPEGAHYGCYNLQMIGPGTYKADFGFYGTSSAVSTMIPVEKYSQYWYMTRCSYSHQLEIITQEEVVVDVRYRDPCVVQLPDRKGWIMVLARERSFDFSAEPPVGEDGIYSDIVAFWAPHDSPGFNGPLAGPLWMVADFAAIEDRNNGPIRTILGTPGVVVMGDTLLLYYSVRPCRNFTTRSGREGEGELLDEGGREFLDEVIDTIGFHCGIYVKSFSLTTVLDRFQNAWNYAADGSVLSRGEWSEATVESAGDFTSSTSRSLVPGTILGPVRVWIPDASGTLQPFARWTGGTGAPTFRRVTIADPAPVDFDARSHNNGRTFTSAEGDPFGLFFAVIRDQDRDAGEATKSYARHGAYGIWRSTSLPGIPGLWTWGQDFIVAPASKGGSVSPGVDGFVVAAKPVVVTSAASWQEEISTDQVVRSQIRDFDWNYNFDSLPEGENLVFTDPDPYHQPREGADESDDADWRINVGSTRETGVVMDFCTVVDNGGCNMRTQDLTEQQTTYSPEYSFVVPHPKVARSVLGTWLDR